MDVMRADTVDLELDRLISRRASQDTRPDPDELEPGYVESVRRFNARQRAENRAAWSEFHRGQAERHKRTLEGLVAHHEAEAEKLMETNEQRRPA
jgi:hypothetical protein